MSEYQTDLQPLRDLLDKWGVEHFTAEELTLLDNPKWTGPRHVCPPSQELRHIYSTIRLADRIRELWGAPIVVTSGYRPPEYNDLVGGSPRSQHLRFRALDLHPADGRIDEFTELVEACIEVADLYATATGFGKYDSFVHIDIGCEHDDYRRWDSR